VRVPNLSAATRWSSRWGSGQQPHGAAAGPGLELQPEVAQVDFGYTGRLWDPELGQLRRAWVFVRMLGYGRHLFALVGREPAAPSVHPMR
jgi:hypothetical protein